MKLFAVALVSLVLAACSPPYDGPLPASDSATAAPATAAPTAAVPAFTVTSPDFTDGGDLPDWATANAYNGQCVGDNLNPALAWSEVPDGTQAFAITLIDRGANNYIHWVQFDIPGTLTGIDRGGSGADGGVEGATNETPGYFGPCPPGPDHRYEFTVYALDAPLGLKDGANFADVKHAIDQHELAQASINGMRSGPA